MKRFIHSVWKVICMACRSIAALSEAIYDLIWVLIFKLASLAATLVMAGLLLIGFNYLYKSIILLGDKESVEDPLYLAVKGIEYLLLAPLALIVINGLKQYFGSVYKRKHGGTSEEATKQEEDAHSQLLVAKSFTVSLLAAAVATALVGKVISKEGMDLEKALPGCLVLLALITLLLAVDRHSKK